MTKRLVSWSIRKPQYHSLTPEVVIVTVMMAMVIVMMVIETTYVLVDKEISVSILHSRKGNGGYV